MEERVEHVLKQVIMAKMIKYLIFFLVSPVGGRGRDGHFVKKKSIFLNRFYMFVGLFLASRSSSGTFPKLNGGQES